VSAGATAPDGRHARGLLLFDGECGLCDRAVRFLARCDRRRRLRFAPLQGDAGAPWRELARPAPGAELEWLVLVEGHDRGPAARVRLGAAAIARALVLAGGPSAIAGGVLALVPRPVADAAYRAVARRRHRLASSCALPVPGDDRFLR
jgi:predicted DCC family thiol-disulfide oxidoreductase YuxK